MLNKESYRSIILWILFIIGMVPLTYYALSPETPRGARLIISPILIILSILMHSAKVPENAK